MYVYCIGKPYGYNTVISGSNPYMARSKKYDVFEDATPDEAGAMMFALPKKRAVQELLNAANNGYLFAIILRFTSKILFARHGNTQRKVFTG